MDIRVTHQPDRAELEKMGVFDWPIWQKEPSTFPWSYFEEETCYILEGEAIVTPEGGAPVMIKAGDLVRLNADLRCMWHITETIKKHYRV